MTQIRLLLATFFVLCFCCALSTPATAQTLTTIYDFGDENVGETPFIFFLGHDGNFYGATSYGGDNSGWGTLYQMTPAGVVTVLYTFTPDETADTSINCLTQGVDGNFYGVDGLNMLFEVTPSGVFTPIHSFAYGTLCFEIVQASDGNLYGETKYGGSDDKGTLFKISPSGTEMLLHQFGDGSVPNDGLNPSGFIQGSDGNFYGSSSAGGSDNDGTIYRITPAGSETILHSFAAVGDGSGPSGLIQAADGDFYGHASGGGTYGYGTFFKITPTGTFTTLHNFSGGTDSPVSLSAQGDDGNFYGVAVQSTDVNGTIFEGNGEIVKLTPDGTPTTLYSFTDSFDGSIPAALVPVGSGVFYGVTEFGGTANGGLGTAFKFTVPKSSPTTWNACDVAAAPDGTGRILWDRSDGAAGIWSVNADDQQSSVGPTYGPFTGWNAQDIAVAQDGTSRILWHRTDRAAGIWNLDASGVMTAIGSAYGPYTDSNGTWTATDIAVASDGTSRLLWTRSDGAAGVWALDSQGTQTSVGPVYGPFAGWTATAIGAAGDGTARLLWTRSDGTAGLWTLDASGSGQSVGPAYGPFRDNQGVWSARDVSTSQDGTSQVLWKRSDNAVGVWTFDASARGMTAGPIYGPYSGYHAAALGSSGGQSRVLWVNSSRAAGLWSFASNDAASFVGSVYGPF